MVDFVVQNEAPGADARGAPAGMPNFVSGPGAGRVEDVVGLRQRWKLDAWRAGGRLVCREITVRPGRGVRPHRHRYEDEAFYVLAGAVVFEGDDLPGGAVRLEAGGFFYAPRGRAHGWRCDGPGPATLLVIVTPGAATSARYGELDELARRQGSGLDPVRAAQVGERYGITPADAGRPANRRSLGDR